MSAGFTDLKQCLKLAQIRLLKQAFVQETLRMYPPVGIGQMREALTDVTIAGKLKIPKGTIVWVPHYGIQNTILNWDEPDKFIPGANGSMPRSSYTHHYLYESHLI